MFHHFKLLVTILALYINTTAPYPAGSNDFQQSFTTEHDDRENQADVTHHFAKHDTANTSSLQLSNEHAHDRRARQVSGCLISKTVQHCGNHQIATVTCRQESVTCIGPGVVSPTCVTQKTYYQACGKAFDTACLCKS